jgi:peptide/nickel transport system ATP-binding protein
MYAGEIIETGDVETIFSHKIHHPYTIGLFGSLPDITKGESRLHPIEGLMPDPMQLPAGCIFCTRCPDVMEICGEQKPPVFTDGKQTIKCHLFHKNQE